MSILHPISGCDKLDRQADVVFVHGLGGDAFKTWRGGVDNESSWPHWLGKEFPQVGVWSLGYAASPTSWTQPLGWFFKRFGNAGQGMALPDRALQVLDLMVQRGLGERPLFFICHSLGGLVTKQILRASDDDTGGRLNHVFASTRAVLFLSTPHAGADLASLASEFRTVFGATVTMQDLRAHDAHLRNLLNWYRNHANGAAVRTVTYYEGRGVKGVTIVNPTSAHPGVGDDPVPLDEDHLSIAKPHDRDAQVCGAARELLRKFVLAAKAAPLMPASIEPAAEAEVRPQVLPALRNGAPGHTEPAVGPVPHEMPPGAEKFVGRQAELAKLVQRMRARKNTAVVGAAGLGKTALAARALVEVVGETAQSLAESPFPDGTVFLDLYALRASANAAWDSLANKLAGPGFMERSPARERAASACQARRVLVLIVLEGAELADGQDGRVALDELLSVLAPQNRWLLLTRRNDQAAAIESVFLADALAPEDAAQLFDALTERRVSGEVRRQALELLEGHPLALTWACNLLIRNDDAPESFVSEWKAERLPDLSDPKKAQHTLEWLFNRSVRGLDATATQALAAAALLGAAPFPTTAIDAALAANTNGTGLPKPGAARPALRSLAQRSLLRSTAQDRWQFTHILGYRFARTETGSDSAVRQRLGHWLREEIASLLAAGGVGGTMPVTHALEHLGALLRTDEDQSLWDPLANAALYDFLDRLTELGRLGQLGTVLDAVGLWLDRLSPEHAAQSAWLRERSTYHNRRGDVCSAQGDLVDALAAYNESLAMRRQLADSNPANAGWQRDLSVSLIKVGDVLSAQGDLADALASYKESMHTMQRLALPNPANAGWQRDLSVSLNRVGDVLSAQGDLAGALAAHNESLQAMRKLAEDDPANQRWQRDLSVSLVKVGEVLNAQEDLNGALEIYEQSRKLSQMLTDFDPSNATYRRDLSVSLNKIGQVLHAQGDLDAALVAHRASLKTRRLLADADPANASWQRDLSVSLDNVGDVLSAQGDLAGALASYQESLRLAERLANSDPSNAGWQRDLSWSLTRMAQFSDQRGDRDEALRLAKESLAIDERLAALDPSNTLWRKDVAVSRAMVARLSG